jgi:asparagine synthase (glutamine-hydrolysing)
MCGLNGVFAYGASAPAPSWSEMIAVRDQMHLRGPDGAGEWWSEGARCGLGHRRLSIIDLSQAANQPMLSADGRLAIVFNGEIYNYRELKAELEAQGVRFRTTSDTEVILALYAREGQACAQRLRGMFAFGLWDADRQGLFLARDPYGIKPLYIANDGGTIRFASQAKALLAGGAVSRAVDSAGLVGFHLFGSVPEPFSFYEAIRPLPAGSSQWVDASGACEPVVYASIAAELAAGRAASLPASELNERVRQAVLDSVRAHLIADVEVGCFLSAGVDSGAILGLMRDAGQPVSQAITLGFKEFAGSSEDETVLAAEVAKLYGANHTVRMVDEAEFKADLPAILDAMDQPSIDGVNTWFVSKAAKEAGLKVALSGLGGDELLAGYPSFRDIPRWVGRMGPLTAAPGLGRLARLMLQTFAPGLVRRQPKAAGMVEYGGTWPGAYLLRRGMRLPFELTGIVDAGLVREGLARLAPLQGIAATLRPDPGSALGRVTALESGNYMKNQLLRDSDWAGMAHSLEIRTPLVDFTLLKALAPLIPNLTAAAGKQALGLAPSVPLPSAIVDRPKTGFALPTGQWMGRSAAAQSKGAVSRAWADLVIGVSA